MSTGKPLAWQFGDEPITDFNWVRSDAALADMAAGLAGQRLALDTEFTRRSTYYAQLALVQVRAGDHRFLVDPLQVTNWSPMMSLFEDSSAKLLHAPLEDFEVFRTYLNTLPQPFVDTQLAAAFAGLGDSLSYAALVKELFGVELAKSQTQSDWMKRPLSDAQVGYALDDVEWLDEAWHRLQDMLGQQGRLDWFQQACHSIVQGMRDEPDTANAWQRIKGLDRLAPEQRGVAAALAVWREGYARRKDKPRNWILRDAAILELARKQPAGQNDLARAGIEPPSLRRHGNAILDAAEAAWAEPLELPATAATLTGEQRNRVKQLRQQVDAMAEQMTISARLIASRNELEQLVQWQDGMQGARAPALLNDWRSASIAPQLTGEVQ